MPETENHIGAIASWSRLSLRLARSADSTDGAHTYWSCGHAGRYDHQSPVSIGDGASRYALGKIKALAGSKFDAVVVNALDAAVNAGQAPPQRRRSARIGGAAIWRGQRIVTEEIPW